MNLIVSSFNNKANLYNTFKGNSNDSVKEFLNSRKEWENTNVSPDELRRKIEITSKNIEYEKEHLAKNPDEHRWVKPTIDRLQFERQNFQEALWRSTEGNTVRELEHKIEVTQSTITGLRKQQMITKNLKVVKELIEPKIQKFVYDLNNFEKALEKLLSKRV